jgi:hypothetical protein
MVRDNFTFLAEDCPVLNVPDRKVLQRFCYGLWKDHAMWLNALSEDSLCTWTLLREKRCHTWPNLDGP